jgi:hypothetical protein
VKISETVNRTVWLTVFGAAMGLLEAAVVVYLRELYYPQGFLFPIVVMPVRIAVVELMREAMTLVMLAAVSVIAERRAIERFFVFAYLFGVWDLTYYAGLKIVLGWPESIWTWDILFLIPVPWLAPVFYPALISVLLIAGFFVHRALARRGSAPAPTREGWCVSIAGAALIVTAFCWRFRDVGSSREPESFPAALFWIGLALATSPFALATYRSLRPDPPFPRPD